MATRVQDLLMGALPELRIHRIHKWIRASLGDIVVAETRAAVVVWEPRRIVPFYAVPLADVRAELVPAPASEDQEHAVRLDREGPPVLDPGTAFGVHTCPGRELTVRTVAGDLVGAAFAPDDPDLADHVLLDWNAFDWREEDEPVLGHPHDPFDRIDCLRSSRHVVLSLHGETLAESTRPTMLFETPLPVRYYLPREDLRMELLEPSTRRTICAYKGHATYWSARVGGELVPDLAWTYEDPLHDARPVAGLISFFTERLDLRVDGVDLERPFTPWS